MPGLNQPSVMPGESFTYKFEIRNSGSHMYHSHFNAAEQVTRGLLGAFVVHDPADPPVDQDVSMVLNDGPLGFTLNGKGFPATQPIVAQLGETLRIRYFNEGLQMHPMHLHGMARRSSRSTATPSATPTPPTPSRSCPGSASTCSSAPPSPAHGPSTATSSTTSRAPTACSAWSPP